MTNRALAKLYEVPRTLKKGDQESKETTSSKELEEMYFKTGDEVLAIIMEDRSLGTTINNYLVNWTPKADGRVHTTWSFSPPTGQHTSSKPNLLNVAKHTANGQRFRRLIEAPPGRCFVAGDWKSFHVATKGYCANDASYIRFSQLDPHSIFGSWIVDEFPSISLEWSDSEILAACKEFKKKYKEIRQAQAKPTVLGNQLGLGPVKLQRQNRRSIATVDEAAWLQAKLKQGFRKTTAWDDWIREKAHKQTFLKNEFGRIQWFFDVFTWRFSKRENRWERKHGSDSEKVLAFPVQSVAFGIRDEKLLKLEEMEKNEEHCFLCSVHDELLYMPEIGKREKCMEMLWEVMTSPTPELVNEATGPKGLAVGIEVSTGRNWANKGAEVDGVKVFEDGNEEGMEEVKIAA